VLGLQACAPPCPAWLTLDSDIPSHLWAGLSWRHLCALVLIVPIAGMRFFFFLPVDWRSDRQLVVKANKTLLVKFKQLRGLEGVALRLGSPGVHFSFNFVYSIDDVLAFQKYCLDCSVRSCTSTEYRQ
jgi:hypothetical protein